MCVCECLCDVRVRMNVECRAAGATILLRVVVVSLQLFFFLLSTLFHFIIYNSDDGVSAAMRAQSFRLCHPHTLHCTSNEIFACSQPER